MGWFSFWRKRPVQATSSGPTATPSPPAVSAPPAGVAPPPPAARAARPESVLGGMVLVRPLVTEKATRQVAVGQYTFEVHPRANKIMVKKAVLQRYGVLPRHVTMTNLAARPVRFGRLQGMRKAWKKAVVTLPPGTKIEVEKTAP